MSWLKNPSVLKFSTWLNTAQGKALIATEAQAMQPWIRHAFGYHGVMLGEPEWAHCLKENPIGHHIWLHPDIGGRGSMFGLSPLTANWHDMPIEADSIDIVYLAHVLEQEAGSVDILREAYRVLLPQGHLVISTFNLWSCFGLWKPFLGQIPGSFWGARWISQAQLTDWLAVLGFTIIETKTVFYRSPYCMGKFPDADVIVKSRFEQLCQIVLPYFGSSFLIFAQKNIRPLTPIKPKWKLIAEKSAIEEGASTAL